MLLYSESILSGNRTVIAVDEPQVTKIPLTFFEGWQSAFDWNPDYLIRRKQIISEDIRLAYAKNQRLPQLDLKASYGLNGLGVSPADSNDDLSRQDFPSWSIGLEMRIPLGGGIKSRNELAASLLRKKQALISLKELENQIANALDTSLHKARSARDDVQNYRTVVAFNEDLLQTRLAQLKAGKVESRKVLEVEAALLEAKTSLAEAKVKYKRALLELELMQGSLLRSLHLELTQRDLEQRTSQLLKRGEVTDQQYQHFLKEVQAAYWEKQPPMDTVTEDKARQMLRDTELKSAPETQPVQPINPDQYQRALELLRQEK